LNVISEYLFPPLAQFVIHQLTFIYLSSGICGGDLVTVSGTETVIVRVWRASMLVLSLHLHWTATCLSLRRQRKAACKYHIQSVGNCFVPSDNTPAAWGPPLILW
jgi:hypothetical protein